MVMLFYYRRRLLSPQLSSTQYQPEPDLQRWSRGRHRLLLRRRRRRWNLWSGLWFDIFCLYLSCCELCVWSEQKRINLHFIFYFYFLQNYSVLLLLVVIVISPIWKCIYKVILPLVSGDYTGSITQLYILTGHCVLSCSIISCYSNQITKAKE